MILLDIQELCVGFDTDEGSFIAADEVSFHISKGEFAGLVGESGCGKSVTALSILRLIPCPPGKISRGKILFNGQNLLTLDAKELRKIRGKEISMIFQEPMSALSPLHRIGDQMAEALMLHSDIGRKDAYRISETWLKKVGISDGKERMNAYPYQLSGGMQQRVMIAMALMNEPALLIADEPTTALDVTVQAQIFRLISDLHTPAPSQEGNHSPDLYSEGITRQDMAMLLITHDMGVVWEMCDRVIVMYASRVVEQGNADDIFSSPAHPYTQGLLASIPKLSDTGKRLHAISGQVPSPLNYPKGCRFQDRCPHVFDRCREEMPLFYDLGNGHKAACYKAVQNSKCKV